MILDHGKASMETKGTGMHLTHEDIDKLQPIPNGLYF